MRTLQPASRKGSFCRRLFAESLEDRRMLAVYFERVDSNSQTASYHAEAIAPLAPGSSVEIQGNDADLVSVSIGNADQISGGGQFAQVERAIVARNLTAPDSAVFVPTVYSGMQVHNSIDGPYYLVAGENFEAWATANAGGSFQLVDDDFSSDPTATFTFYGTFLIIGAGSDVGSSNVDFFLDMSLFASANGRNFGATMDGDHTEDWTINDASEDVPVQYESGGRSIEHFINFEITGLTHGSLVNLSAWIYAQNTVTLGMSVPASGNGQSNWELFTSVWGYVTRDGDGPGGPGGPGGGDVNGDGSVGISDWDLWTRLWNAPALPGGGVTYVEGDLNSDGVVDGNDADIILDALAAQNIFIVSSDDDFTDADRDFNELTLREALAQADVTAGADTIYFAPWISNVTLSSALPVASDVDIVGPGVEKLTIDADGGSRVFYVAGTGTLDVEISGMTIKGGAISGNGAGIYNASENLTLSSVVVTDNHATGTGLGGGLFSANGVVEIFNSEFYGNTATRGAGIRVQGFPAVTLSIYGSSIYENTSSAGEGGISAYSATSYIENSTISGNTAGQDSGGILVESSGQMTIINSTIVNNTATNYGGGLRKTGGTVTLHNTIVANNQNLSGWGPTQDLHGPLELASSYNIFGAGSSGQSFTGSGNIIGTPTSRINPQLAPLGDYGGKTKTHALLTNSPALDKGSNDWSLPYDQRGVGFVREHDLPTTDGGDGYRDIGAFEAGLNTELVVRSDGDRSNSVSLQATTDSLRLREAIALSNALAGGEVIIFDKSLYAAGPAEITLTYDGPDSGSTPDTLLVGSSDLTIRGPGAQHLTVSGDNQTGVFWVANAFGAGTVVSLSGMTLTEGNSNAGGAIYAKWADLTLDGLRIVGNSAGAGGGIYSEDVHRLKIINTEISDNTAEVYGGGIADTRYGLLDAPGLQIINSTISNNEVTDLGGMGGGLYAWRDDDGSLVELTIVNSTIAANKASYGGGVLTETVTGNDYVQLLNSIVADNVDLLDAPSDIEGLDVFGQYNLIGLGGSGGLTNNVANNIVLNGVESARLMPLDFYGGPTRTHALKYDSPAAEAGNSGIATLWDLGFDQRGYERDVDNMYTLGDNVDIGAFELALEDYYS